jgi:hypothetical protein
MCMLTIKICSILEIFTYPGKTHSHKAQKCDIVFSSDTIVQPLHQKMKTRFRGNDRKFNKNRKNREKK